MLFKILIVALLISAAINLLFALRVMLSNNPEQPSMSKYLGRRLVFSALIVLILLIAFTTGVASQEVFPFN